MSSDILYVPNEKECQMVFSVKHGKSRRSLTLNDIVRIEASGAYSNIICDDGSKYIISKCLADIEKELATDQMLRVHRSHLVHKLKIEKLCNSNGLFLLLSNQDQIAVSRRKRESIKLAIA